uniref:Uncharacterized protein n=1 Tax=Arundo donax TaxID=35708 RepID=A0A0A8Y4A1_ARUDO
MCTLVVGIHFYLVKLMTFYSYDIYFYLIRPMAFFSLLSFLLLETNLKTK